MESQKPQALKINAFIPVGYVAFRDDWRGLRIRQNQNTATATPAVWKGPFPQYRKSEEAAPGIRA
jgi:hypothetical protein